jgi:hypothetical protein
MSIRHVMVVSLALMVSLPVWSTEKVSQRKAYRGPAAITPSSSTPLSQIYQTLISDSQKKLSPAAGENAVYLPASVSQQKSNRSPASVSDTSSLARHAAMPWAADPSLGGARFSLK